MAIIINENIWHLLNKYYVDTDPALTIDLICVICHQIIKDCRQSLCGCRYCCKCIKNYLDDKDKQCPGSTKYCKEQLINFSRDVQIDHVANLKLSRLEVKCPEIGCQHIDELGNIGDHINSHNIKCYYFDVGCDKTGLSSINIGDHLTNDKLSHSKLLTDYLNQMKNDLSLIGGDSQKKTHILTTIDQEIKILQETYTNQSESINKLQSDVYDLRNELKNWKRKNENSEELVMNLLNKIDELDGEMRTKFEELQKMIKNVQVNNNEEEEGSIGESQMMTLKTFEPQIISTESRIHLNQVIAPFKWKINQFSEKQISCWTKFSRSISSEPFYSSKFGYKMCLVVWPSGSSVSNYTHMSIGFRLMKGEFDDRLPWPMKWTVTISLVNQKSNDVYVSEQYQYNSSPEKYKICFNKPQSVMNKFLGNPHFIYITGLMNNKEAYQNDSIIITCSVSQ